ncbi:hypothetical protein ACF0H5_022386 [Mactra antiquata]
MASSTSSLLSTVESGGISMTTQTGDNMTSQNVGDTTSQTLSNMTSSVNKIVILEGPIFNSVEEKYFGIMVYPLCVIVVYIVLGLLGNIVVFYVFFVKWKRNKTSVFIAALALLDILNCSVNMPIEIGILSKPISFDYDIFCKISRYLSYVTTASYSFVLVAVAFDRYLMVCRPLKRMTLGKRYAIRTCISAVTLGVITEWPSVLIYGTFTFEIPLLVTENSTIVALGRTCLVTNYNYYEEPTLTYAFQGFLFTGHVVIFSALTIMYIIIGRRLYISSHTDFDSVGKRRGLLKDSLVSAITGSVCCGGRSKSISADNLPYSRTKRSSNVSYGNNGKSAANSRNNELSNGNTNRNTISRSLNNIHLQLQAESGEMESAVDSNENEAGKEKDENRKINQKFIHKGSIRPHSHPGTDPKHEFESVTPSTSGTSFPRSLSVDSGQIYSVSQIVDKPKADIKEISLKRNTLIMRMVTFTFMLSYLPFLIIVTLRYSNPDIPKKLDRTALIVYHVFLRSYFFNSITRPFIYAVMNKDYRKCVREIFQKV